jgi:acyl carrier protein
MMTRDEAMDWIANLFEEDPDNLRPDMARDEIPAWDSLGILSLMAGLDEEFEVLLSDDDIQSLRSIDDILAVLKRNGRIAEV